MKLNKMIALPILALSVVMIGCSSVKKADIAASANPSEEIANLEQKIQEGYAGHFDVLAEDDFSKSREYLKEAKEDLAEGDDQSDILENVAYAQSYYTRASEKAMTRKGKIPRIIEARQKAIDAGARKYPPTQRDLARLDDDIRDDAQKLEKLEASEVSALQSKYLQLELDAVMNTQLGKSNAQIQGSKDKKAGDHAPMALKRAELDYQYAANLIAANRNTPSTYEAAVAKSNNTSDLLVAILATTRSGKIDENSATKIVMQDRQIRNLEGQVTAAGEENQQLGTEIAQQGAALKRAGRAISMQESLDKARKEFTREEADVFQQGDKLLIRLKSMNFASGRSDLPSDALPVLAKVKGVAEGLNPQQIVIEGHTDSTGSAELNKKLSQERASAIANYLGTTGLEEQRLQSVGYGFKKPIASNKSKEGRSQNRRVDIVITPENTQSQTNSEQM